MNILQDIKTAVRLTAEVRRARMNGDRVEVHTVPVHKIDWWPMTVEFTMLQGRQAEAVRDVFHSFDNETQHSMFLTPVAKGWADRARFWQKQLKPALPPRLYHAVMMQFISRYARRMRIATGVEV